MQNAEDKSTGKNDDQQQENKNVAAAHEAADKDIDQDPDLSLEPSPGDDLDEGELARLEGED